MTLLPTLVLRAPRKAPVRLDALLGAQVWSVGPSVIDEDGEGDDLVVG